AAGVAQEQLAVTGDAQRPGRGHLDRRVRRPGAGSHHRHAIQLAVAVVIASDLGKDIAGEPLLRGVSFKLLRRDRMTLSGRNGAGKTTLLRMLAAEASIDTGELVLAKGAKVALHDQRPPRERSLTLRDYVLSGARELVVIEEELSALEQAMADGAHDSATLRRYSEAQ